VVLVAEQDASELDVSELRWLKREFSFYCIELSADPQEAAFVVGGRDNDGSMLPSMERYDASGCAWREAAPMATERSEFGLCKLSDGEFYATGGIGINDVRLASVERYDVALDTWSATPPLPRPRFAHCACAVGNAMYVLSGVEMDDPGDEYTVNSVLKFDSSTQIWSEVAPMPAERHNAGACVVGVDIYIFGGTSDNQVPTSTTYRFNSEANEWTTLAPMPEAMQEYSIAVLDGLIYLIGGVDSGDDSLDSVHRFDPVANLWRAVAPMSVARSALGSFVLGGSIYAVGGFDGEDRLSSMERYSVASDSWSEVIGGKLSAARSRFCVQVMQLEVDLFDSLIAKAKREGL
jgi:hypothetical protein